MSLQIENLSNDETVHQSCILVCGKYPSIDIATNSEDFVSISTQDGAGSVTFPIHSWPIVDGRFKALVLLSPGPNKLNFHRGGATETIDYALTITYIPLLQAPPLHLAVMIAKDSPLLIDCPPAKRGAFSSAHSSLDAAIAKFRMTAYMWQALTAEDMRSKGLGRRSFRLEEEWAADTTSQNFLHGLHESALCESGAMRPTPKIHLIRSEKTVAEIRDAQLAQQNPSAYQKEKLFDYFLEALKAHGGPFESSARPVVAGLILDSHYSASQNLILGHAALGCHNANGISLGMFGSHLTYSWPRFLEEVSSCLLDARNPGDTVGNDNGECGTFWEACSIGQGAFLHEVGHAFGSPHTTGIMARGYAQHWPKNFMPKTAYCAHTNKEGFVVIDGETENDARWDLRDALSFSTLPHFRLPGDVPLAPSERSAVPSFTVDEHGKEGIQLRIASKIGIVNIQFDDKSEPSPSIRSPISTASYTLSELESRFDRASPLKLRVLGLNGKERAVKDAWRLFNNKTYIRIPGSDIVLQKRSVMSQELEQGEGEDDKTFWTWATLLTQRMPDGTIKRATKVDVRTGCILDGAYVYFGNDFINCGPKVNKWGHEHHFGGHAAEKIHIPKDQEIVKVEVGREWSILRGLRMHLSNGVAGGALSGQGDDPETIALEAAEGERIVGFYGRSFWGERFDGIVEFGIITAPKDAELPEVVYGMTELQNTDGGVDLDEENYRHGSNENDDEYKSEDEDDMEDDG